MRPTALAVGLFPSLAPYAHLKNRDFRKLRGSYWCCRTELRRATKHAWTRANQFRGRGSDHVSQRDSGKTFKHYVKLGIPTVVCFNRNGTNKQPAVAVARRIGFGKQPSAMQMCDPFSLEWRIQVAPKSEQIAFGNI